MWAAYTITLRLLARQLLAQDAQQLHVRDRAEIKTSVGPRNNPKHPSSRSSGPAAKAVSLRIHQPPLGRLGAPAYFEEQGK